MFKPNEPPHRTGARARWIRALVGLGALLASASAAHAQSLTASDVQHIVNLASQEAFARRAWATVAVVDRDGNVLTVYRQFFAGLNYPSPPNMNFTRGVNIASNDRGANGGLNGAEITDTGAAIAKAITGAYLSSSGNAFSTRTASQIVQDHFNPGVASTPSGPLYGVQFSSLPCSDVNRRSVLADPSHLMLGPKRSPYGLSADPGGFPLYKNGVVVGGVGVMSDNVYGDDENVFDTDVNSDEIIALAATTGYEPPSSIRADKISAGGITLRYSDATPSLYKANTANADSFNTFGLGAFVSVPGYYDLSQGFVAGTQHGTPASGLAPDTSGAYSTVTPPLLMVNADGSVRYPAHAGHGPEAFTAVEVATILREGYQLSLRERAAIRNPLGSQVAITLSVVDVNGEILGSVTNPDAPVFGIDVSVQKARTALLMSGPYIRGVLANNSSLTTYLTQAQSFFGANILDGTKAISARALGTLARDTYPDGIGGTPNGPFGVPYTSQTPFNVGLQSSLIINDIVKHLTYLLGAGSDVGEACTSGIVPAGPNSVSGAPILADGLQIFPGGFPVYRADGKLIGAVGVSGDGVSQDDMTAYLSTYYASLDLYTGFGNAWLTNRISQLSAHGASPLYLQCPTTPLLNDATQDLCAGK